MRPALLFVLPAVVALATYAGVHGFGFLGDDVEAIAQNDALWRGDVWAAAYGSYTSLANRPLPCASLALDLACGLGPGGMHVVAALLHAANAALAALAVAACLRAPAVGFAPTPARCVAAAVACVWAVHPLHVDAVAYLTQRSQLLAGGAALLALWALARANEAAGAVRWRALCVGATAAALLCKEEAAALPLLLVLADEALWPGPGRWRRGIAMADVGAGAALRVDEAAANGDSAIRGRAAFRFALLASWSVLAISVALGPRNPTVGYATIPPCTAWEWLLTQVPVLWHYAQNVVPTGDMRGQYDFAIVRQLGPVAWRGACIVALLVVAAAAWRRRPPLALALTAMFLLLAPTSSILPIVTEPCADRRMYLPLLPLLVVPAAWGARRFGVRRVLVVAALATALLVSGTRPLLQHYRDDVSHRTLAGTANELRNGSFMAGRILAAHASALYELAQSAGIPAAAREAMVRDAADRIERALQCEAPGADTRLNHANLLEGRGDGPGAEAVLRRLAADYPQFAKGLGNLARLLLARAAAQPAQAAALHAEADDLSARAVASAPRDPIVANTRGVVCYTLRGAADALPFLQRAVALQPSYFEAQRNLGVAWQALGEPQRALDCWRPLLALRPDDPVLRQQVREAEAALARSR